MEDQKEKIKKRERESKNNIINIGDLKNMKTCAATIRASLMAKHIYLPSHRRGKTSMRYMKEIMNGSREYIKTHQVNYVSVPLFNELKPENVIRELDWNNKFEEGWNQLLNFCPEIKYKGCP